MITYPLANANSSVISVTGTASYILPLIDTAGSTRHAFPNNLDAINITPEDGDIRIFTDSTVNAIAPTASKGFLIRQGSTFMLRRTNLRFIKAIATTGTVSCSVEIGSSEQEEYTAITGGGGAITSIIPGTGATSLGKAEDATHTSGDVGVMALTRRIDTPASSAAASGRYATQNTDSLGHMWSREGYASTSEDNPNQVNATAVRPLAVSTYSWTRFQNLGANATLNVKATPGNVKAVYCHNINAAAHYVQLHNTATTPAGGAVPLYTFLVPAQSSITIGDTFFGEHGAHFTTGIAFAFSTTEATYTAATATDQMTHIMYK